MLQLIIYGWRGLTRTKESGQFHCPVCSGPRDFRHRVVRRWFTLYFIPVIPLTQMGEFIECGECKGTFKVEVLNYNPQAAEQQVHLSLLRAQVLALQADRALDQRGVALICDRYQSATGIEIDYAFVMQQAELAAAAGTTLARFVQENLNGLTDKGKEMALRSTIAVLAPDGQLSARRQELLGELAMSMGMSPAHFNGVLADAGLMSQPRLTQG